MTTGIRTDSSGTYGALQVGGADVAKFGSKGLYGVLPATSYADDTAAAAAGIPIGGLYHTTGTVKVRLS